MNREILFRGFHKDENGTETIYLNGEEIKGNWVYGYLEKQEVDGEEYYITSPCNEILNRCHVVIPETVGQYTGLDDKNGKKIFENDVAEDTDENIEYIVGFCDGAFSLFTKSGKHNSFLHNWNVPDFLKVIRTTFDDKKVK